MLENTTLLGKEFKDLVIPPSMATYGPLNPGFWSSSQVALRVRPISVAELEEGATLIAHKMDEQVLGAATRSCRVEAGSPCSAYTPGRALHSITKKEAFFSQEDFLEQTRKSYELLEPG
jgi:hypothetical protein